MRPTDPPAPTLAFAAATALFETTSAILPDKIGELSIKWPNDLLLAGVKVAGILLEREGDAVVIGFGVNLAHHPNLPDRPTASLGARTTPAEFLPPLCENFDNFRNLWRTAGIAPILRRWSERAHPPGTPLTARLPDAGTVSGTFERLASDGALVLRLADGSRRVIHAADVFLV